MDWIHVQTGKGWACYDEEAKEDVVAYSSGEWIVFGIKTASFDRVCKVLSISDSIWNCGI